MSVRSNAKQQIFAAGIAAFCVYFAMYGFRKPVTAQDFAGQAPVFAGIGYKATLVIAQALGYAASKLIGIHVVAGHSARHRACTILSLIGLSWLALLGFALLPPVFGPACLFFNGLPLGIIWGLVFSYLEGRRASELLAAMLTSSFILSSGFTKSVGSLLVQTGVPPFWMPALTGLIFTPLLLGAMLVLARTPPPSALDRAERGERRPMDRGARGAYLRRYAVPVATLIAGYTLLAALRDFRDNFAAELWAELGHPGSSAIFALSEIPVTIVVLIGLAALSLVRDNLGAVLTIHGAVLVGALLMGGATWLFQAVLIGPLAWMILVGIGIYLAYAPFSAVLFDRMLSLSRQPGNAGFLIYIADSCGYSGSVGLLLLRELADPGAQWLGFFIEATLVTSVALAVVTLLSMLWFVRTYRNR